MRIHKGECVYLLEAGGSVKVGFSTDVESRIRSIQCGCDAKLQLIDVWYHSRSRQLERLAHQALKPFRMKGGREWFAVLPSLAILVVNELIIQMHRPEPKLMLVCKTCGHTGIVAADPGRFRCSECSETRSIRYLQFPTVNLGSHL